MEVWVGEHAADMLRATTVFQGLQLGDKDRGTNIDLYSVAIGKTAAHMTFRKEAIGE